MIPQLITHLWQSTLFAGAAALLVLTLRKNPARVRYGIWFIASAKFLIPFSMLVGLGTLVPRHAATPAIQTRWMANVEQVEQAAQPLATLPNLAARVVITAEGTHQNYFQASALALWASGFAAIAICWLARWKRILALRRSAVPVSTKFPVPVMSAPGLLEPGIFGIFQPVLLLPEGIGDQLECAQLDAILAHELCHVRRRDNLTSAIHMTVQAIFWFHPLVWWLGARLVDERERACDEEVLRLGNKPQVYAAGILSVCKLYAESPLACVSGVTGADLKKRIQMIVSGHSARKLGFARKALLAAAATGCLALPILIGVWSVPQMLGELRAYVPGLQTSTARFHSVSITPCKDRSMAGVSLSPGRLVLTCQTWVGLIQLAWSESVDKYPQELPDGLREAMVGKPAAVAVRNRFNIEAQADDGANPELMEGPMLQALLQDRFAVKVHTESRIVPMYSLSVTKSGAKLQPSKGGNCREDLDGPLYYLPFPPMRGGGKRCVVSGADTLLYTQMYAQGITLQHFCQLLEGPLQRPVVDKTGISGRFDFNLGFADKSTPPSLGQLYRPLPEVVQAQLGLTLDPFTGPREFFVIDQVKSPLQK